MKKVSANPPKRLSDYFNLNKGQRQLDFVDVYISSDSQLFIDPSLFRVYDDEWSNACHNDICRYFQALVDLIKAGNKADGLRLLQNLSETEETHLGFSATGTNGRGVGSFQANDLYEKLSESTAVRTGFVTDLSDCELMVEGISFDKISDVVTNIIRHHLIIYTQKQCELLGIPMSDAPSGFIWNSAENQWLRSTYVQLPHVNNNSLLFVPKKVVVWSSEFDSQHFYNNDILQYLQAYHLHAGSALVETLKNGTQRVTKKSLKEQPEYQYSKEFIYGFCNKHPEILKDFKKRKQSSLKQQHQSTADWYADVNEKDISEELIEQLPKIQLGNKSASEFHNFCIGALEFILFPTLNHPQKEREVHEGRKRIDIVFHNDAQNGFFFEMRTQPQYRSAIVMIECKNYTHDITNPEIDQLSGRFSEIRGKFGLLIARQFDDRETFIKRCRDTVTDGRGLVIPLVDEDIINLLQLKGDGKTSQIEEHLKNIYQEIII